MSKKILSLSFVIVIIVGLFATTALLAQDDSSENEDDAMMNTGLLTVQSELSFDDTVANAQAILEEEGFGIPLVLDHSANAASVDLDLPPTTLILFGNPQVGTSFMQESRSAAIDLPQKFLVWEDDAGNVYITYNDPTYVANRHGITEQDDKLATVADRLQSLAEMIASSDPMMDMDDDTDMDDEGDEDEED